VIPSQTDAVRHPYLSVVAVSRNDDHGGDPLKRTQLFITSLAGQADEFSLAVELILVDWNPPHDRPGLADVLHFPVNPFFSARVIVVPPALHEGFRHADRLPLFQMIGKNVGIRRSRGEFILATNIDILLDDLLFSFPAQRKLDPTRMYRADRYDIRNELVEITDGKEALQFCRDPQNQLRRNHRKYPPEYERLQETDPVNSRALRNHVKDFSWLEPEDNAFPRVVAAQDMPADNLATNACGDFTLLHREAWMSLRGYGEFEAYSMHIDSIGCALAHFAGYRETCLLPPLVCYHIEHAPASGWTPEAGETLYKKISGQGLPWLHWEAVRTCLLPIFRSNPELRLNDERWGLAEQNLEEYLFTHDGGNEHLPGRFEKPKNYRPLSALYQNYEPCIQLQNYLNSKPYLYFQRLIAHPLWKIIHVGILTYRMAKKIGKFFMQKINYEK
jgi:hypothetical protein